MANESKVIQIDTIGLHSMTNDAARHRLPAGVCIVGGRKIILKQTEINFSSGRTQRPDVFLYHVPPHTEKTTRMA